MPGMAAYGWALPEEVQNKARVMLNEVPEKSAQDIEAVRDQIITRPDIDFLRSDDAFILRFLRARKFRRFEAFKLYARYFEYRQLNTNLFKKFHAQELGIKLALLDGFPGVLPEPDQDGRRILVVYTYNWENKQYGLASIYRALLLSLERLVEEDLVQVNGVVLIVDWSQFTFKQSTWIHPHTLKLMVQGLQDCFPIRFEEVHFVNQPWYVEAVFKVIRPFMQDEAKDKIHMHGNNMAPLYTHITREVLPAELGGGAPPYHIEPWARQLIGEEGGFSYGEKHIYWPDHCTGIKTRSETFPLDQYTSELEMRGQGSHSGGTQLDEEFFLQD